MHLVYLPVNAAWVFVFGKAIDTAQPTRMGDGPMFFNKRDDAVEAAHGQGLQVEADGSVRALHGDSLNGLDELGATPERDAKLRSVAVDIAEMVFGTFTTEEGAGSLLSTIAKGGHAYVPIHFEAVQGTETRERLRELGLPAQVDFELVFLEQGPQHRVAGYAAQAETDDRVKLFGGSQNLILIWVLPPNAQHFAREQPEALWRYIFRALDGNPDILIHEITHMLDNWRGGGFMYGKPPPYEEPSAGEDIAKARRAYINNPIEFNAMFQQGVFELGSSIEHMGTGDRSRLFRSFRNFKREADKTRGIAMLQRDVRGKWKRKLETRLWQTYNFWKNEEG